MHLGEIDSVTRALAMRSNGEKVMLYTGELEKYRQLIHFPEEVALMLTRVELRLIQQVPPANYLRHITSDLSAWSKLAKSSATIPKMGLVDGTLSTLINLIWNMTFQIPIDLIS